MLIKKNKKRKEEERKRHTCTWKRIEGVEERKERKKGTLVFFTKEEEACLLWNKGF